MGLELGIAGQRRRRRFDEGPAQPFTILLNDAAVPALPRKRRSRAPAGIGRQLGGRAEAGEDIDLGVDQPAEKLADTGDAHQPRDIGIALGERLDRCVAFFDTAIDVVDEDEAAVDLQPVDGTVIILAQCAGRFLQRGVGPRDRNCRPATVLPRL
jgi:hypothetical protein